MTNEPQKLSVKEKVSYGVGDFASCLFWMTFMYYFTYFYTDVFVIPAAAAATLFLVSRIFDGINDPIVGMIADRTKTRWGKFRPYLLWLCVPFAVMGVLTFTVPDLEMRGKIIWAYITFNGIMMLYTAINIPYTALLGVISADSKERTTVSSVKFVFAYAAGIIVAATLLLMAKQFGKGDESIINANINNQIVSISEVGNGNALISLSAEDPEGISGKSEFRFRVVPVNNNIPVVTQPISDIKLESGFATHQIDISGVFKGNEGKPFEYKVENQNKKVQGGLERFLLRFKFKDKVENQNKEIVEVELKEKTLLVKEKQVGNAKINLTAEDKRWGSRTISFYIDVFAKGNNAPIIKNLPNNVKLKSGFGKEEIDLSKFISDPDGDVLTFKAESSNSKVILPEIDGNKLTFVEAEPGIAQVTITATDGKGGRLVNSIKYLISAIGNNPPYVNASVDNIIKNAGFKVHELGISELFIDPEGKPLDYKVEIINEASGWQRSFIIYGIVAVIFFLITFAGTKERVQPPKAQESSVKKDIFELITNGPWLILLAATITFILFVAVRGSVTAHYFKYFVGPQQVSLPFVGAKTYSFEALVSAFNTVGQVSALIGVVIINWFAKVVGKKKAFVIFFVIAIISTASFYFLTAEQMGLIFILQIIGSMTGGPLSVLLWAMYADTADYAEWKRGRRATGLIFSASTMSQKFGWAFGAYLALTLMSQVGFAPNQEQSPESLRGLILLFTLIPAGIGILSIILLLIYPLGDKRVAVIEAELIERRNKEEQ
ncbi:MAG: MFS transporter [Phycisphaerae bacterium]|nr:MFS transporter [Phycisphaerae bacterium]